MISVAVVCGLFGAWMWIVLNDDEGIARPVNRLLARNSVTEKFMRCPWCSGAWFALVPSLILLHEPLAPALITAFAAAAITGLLGSYFGD